VIGTLCEAIGMAAAVLGVRRRGDREGLLAVIA